MKLEHLLQQLISIPSFSGNEGEIQKWIFQYLVDIKLQPEWVGPNVVVKIQGKDSMKALIFNGHVDTVSPGDKASWIYNPYSGKLVHGKLYGLGSTDMKSGIAVMLALCLEYAKKQPNCNLWFHFVVKEETDGSGTGEVMQWFGKNHKRRYKTLAGIIAEPTNISEIVIAHKGNIFLKVTVKGDGGHGSTPEKIKLHAISKMHKVAKDLSALVKSWEKKYRDEILGIPTIAWTSIQAGNMESPNKIADTCIATFDIRTTPQIHEKALDLIKQAVALDNTEIEALYAPLPCGYTDKKEHIVKIAQQITHLPTDKTPGATDLLFFTAQHIPAVILGPGEKTMEHTVNEYVYLSKVEKCLKIFQQIIENF